MVSPSLLRCCLATSLALLFLIAPQTTFSQNSFNVEQVTVLQHETCPGLALEDDILYFCDLASLFSVDVSNPYNPVYLDTIDWNYDPRFDMVQDMVIDGNYLHLATTYEGLLTIDITDPHSLQIASRVPYVFKRRAHAMHRKNDLLFVLTMDSARVFSIADTQAPLLINAYPYNAPIELSTEGDPWYFISEDTVLFTSVVGFLETSLLTKTILPDGSLHTIDSVLISDGPTSGLILHGNILYRGFGHSLEIFTIDAPGTVTRVNVVTTESFIADFKIIGNLLYCISFRAPYTVVYDISEPLEPELIAKYFDPWAGYFYRQIINGEYVFMTTGAIGLHIIKLDSTQTSLPNPQAASFSLSPAYPNPVSPGSTAQVRYSLPSAGNITLLLHDALGRELRRISKRVEPGEHAESIPTVGLTPGVYYYSLLASGQKKTEMLIVR
ncbi:MAG: hypothetical protein CL946_01915 [Ectothiorhodospiraceae bacterium]|nr:hypothetical protein [Ectothiorhodospiraceae bacterium]